MFSQPNIVLRLPQEYDNIADANNNHRGSPIKALHRLYDIDAVTTDYLTLFGGENTNQNSQPHQRDSRKLNMGEKIKNKLQSTNNKSSKVLSNPHFNISQFNCDNSSNEQSKLYESSHQLHKQQRQQEKSQLISQFQSHSTSKKQIHSEIKSSIKNQNQIMKLYRQTSEDSCLQSSPYNNISAKTYQSSPDVQSSVSQNSQNTPINNLNNISGVDTPLSQPHQLNIYKHLIKEISEFSYEKNNIAPLIKLNKVVSAIPYIQIKDVPMVSSQSIDVQHRDKIQNVQSVCLSCDEEQDHHQLTGYQYAMKQLKKLQQNVYELQVASKNLAQLKINQNSGIFPSYIGKIESRNKLNESFLQFFEENLKDILYEPQKQQYFTEQLDSNQKSAQFCPQEYLQNKNVKSIICQTPKQVQKNHQQTEYLLQKNIMIQRKFSNEQQRNEAQRNKQIIHKSSNTQRKKITTAHQNKVLMQLSSNQKMSDSAKKIASGSNCILKCKQFANISNQIYLKNQYDFRKQNKQNND